MEVHLTKDQILTILSRMSIDEVYDKLTGNGLQHNTSSSYSEYEFVLHYKLAEAKNG